LFDNKGDEQALTLLEGFRYRSDLISAADEADLLERVVELPFREFEFHGYFGKRRVVSFGWRYDYSGSRLRKADDIPGFLIPLRSMAASFAGLEPDNLEQVLVTEYRAGAGIGWHRDKPVFGQVIGVSLLAPCVLRFRQKVSGDIPSEPGRSKHWERVNLTAEPRSVYLLSGPARSEWEHSILRVGGLRYSITFRTLRKR
jgi:alkylated DNA repair dioxygenase AlkB